MEEKEHPKCACGQSPEVIEKRGCHYVKCQCGKCTTYWVSPSLALHAWEEKQFGPSNYDMR